MSGPKSRGDILLYVWVSDDEYATIQECMAQDGTQNLSAYIRKMAPNGYVLNVTLPLPGSWFPCNADVPTI